jgi:hypothetical protein
LFGPALWEAPWWAAAGLAAPSLVVGQHPDEATDSIADYGAASGCGFAVMP